MLRVVIIDDEVLARVGIKSMMDWAELGCEVVGDADNGESGLELIRKLKPDIVITDIKMPVMDGLELMERVKRENRHIKFIVLSSYDEFQLVKQAMKMGTEEYLIKLDLNPQLLASTVKTVIDKISAEVMEKNEQNRLEMYLRRDKRALTEEFFKKLIGKLIPSKNDLYDTVKHLGIELWEERLYCAVVSVKDIRNRDRYAKKEDMELFDFYVMNITEEITNDYFSGYTVRTDTDQFTIVFSVKEPMDRKLYRETVEKMGKRLIEMLNQYVGIAVSIGISNAHSGFFDLNQAYHEGVKAVDHSFFVGAGQVIFFSDLSGKLEKESHIRVQSYRAEMAKALEMQDISAIERVFDRVIEVFKSGGINRGQAYDLCYQTAYMVSDTVDFEGNEPGKPLDAGKSLYETITGNNTLPEMMKWMENLKNTVCTALSTKGDLDPNVRLVAAAKKYIHENYKKDLTLNDVAAVLNISHCYFSTIFKNIAGINFIDYVTNVKMSEAKKILLESDCKVYEVAKMLGYENAYYFSRVFKKVTGMTPSEFIEKKY